MADPNPARRGRAHAGRTALLCVTGGIAAYKALELTRRFRQAGWNVVVAMTPHARRLVGPESFAALSGNPVALDLFPPRHRPDGEPARIAHVDLAASADLVVVAPATANIIGKLASGVADDLVSTVLLAIPQETVAAGRVLLAPAMNTRMWEHPAVRRNLAVLSGWGYRIAGPAAGELACGDRGAGRLLDLDTLFGMCRAALEDEPLPDLADFSVLVTAGRTEEPLDPVRVITNRSSGRMGIEVARAFAAARARTRLIAAGVSVPLPESVDTRPVRTAAELTDAVLEEAAGVDALVMCAAVADYRPVRASPAKRHDAKLAVALERTPDILRQVSKANRQAILIGFSHDPSLATARAKLRDKGLDLVVANPYETAGADDIDPVLVRPKGRAVRCGPMPKWRFARRLVRETGRLLAAPRRGVKRG